MKDWTLAELIADVKFRVAFNEGQTDMEYRGPAGDVDRHFRDAINEAYADEYNEAAIAGDPRWWYVTMDLPWPASQPTLTIPESVNSKWQIRLFDVTDDQIGSPIWSSNWPRTGHSVYWHDRSTLRWADTAGPPRSLTLRLTYCGAPAELVQQNDIPILLPSQFRHILSWSAAIKLRIIGDDAAPSAWIAERNRMRAALHKFLSLRGPLQTDTPMLVDPNQDTLSGFQY
jgi:hypothetical protein